MTVQRYRALKNFKSIMGLTFVLLCIISSLFAYSQVIAQDISKPVKAPVIFKGQTLFHIKAGLGSLTPETRANKISQRLKKLYKDPFNRLNSITIQNTEKSTDILAGDVIIMSITDNDAEAIGISRTDLTRAYIKRLQIAVDQPGNKNFWINMPFDIFFTLLATLFLVFAFKILKFIL